MANRIRDMRIAMVEGLKKHNSPHDWSHITNQIGMFAFTGLRPEHVNRLREEYHVYLTQDGRISIAGLNTKNVDFVAQCFHAVTKDSKL